MGRFQLHPGRGAKNAKGVESESLREQKIMRAQRATLIQVGSCRVTNALLSFLHKRLTFCFKKLSLSSFLAFLAPFCWCS